MEKYTYEFQMSDGYISGLIKIEDLSGDSSTGLAGNGGNR